MKAMYIGALVLGCSAFAVGVCGISQAPEDAKQRSEAAITPIGNYPKPTNLKVLPKDISGSDIDKLMHRYQRDLGVPCGYCHDQNPQTKVIDFTSDENPIKDTARFMITMTSDINTKYLGQLGDRRYSEPLTCGNCHQGQVQPPTFSPKGEQ
jgi:hypothetical protein